MIISSSFCLSRFDIETGTGLVVVYGVQQVRAPVRPCSVFTSYVSILEGSFLSKYNPAFNGPHWETDLAGKSACARFAYAIRTRRTVRETANSH